MTAPRRSPRPGAGGVDRRRSRGSGGIREIRSGVFLIDVEAPRRSELGRRSRVSRTVVGTRADAELALAELKLTGEQRIAPLPTSAIRNVRAVFDLYLNEAAEGRIELAPKTLVTSRSATRTMASQRLSDGSSFGEIRLDKLSWEHIEEMYAAMRRNGLGSDWIRRCGTVLSRSLDYARRRKMISNNPSVDARRPKTVRHRPYAPDPSAVEALINNVREVDAEIADAVEIVAGTGMRVGEFLALQFGDVDLERRELHVAWAITDGGKGVGLLRKPTKTADWRDVPLVESVVEAFRRQIERRRSIVGRDPGDRDYLFAGDDDGERPLRPDTFSDRFSAARGASKITFLHIRHYVATKLLDAGVPIRTVAELLGNSEATIRLHYDGLTNTDKRGAVVALERSSG